MEISIALINATNIVKVKSYKIFLKIFNTWWMEAEGYGHDLHPGTGKDFYCSRLPEIVCIKSHMSCSYCWLKRSSHDWFRFLLILWLYELKYLRQHISGFVNKDSQETEVEYSKVDVRILRIEKCMHSSGI